MLSVAVMLSRSEIKFPFPRNHHAPNVNSLPFALSLFAPKLVCLRSGSSLTPHCEWEERNRVPGSRRGQEVSALTRIPRLWFLELHPGFAGFLDPPCSVLGAARPLLGRATPAAAAQHLEFKLLPTQGQIFFSGVMLCWCRMMVMKTETWVV